jgi:hypothetical protein
VTVHPRRRARDAARDERLGAVALAACSLATYRLRTCSAAQSVLLPSRVSFWRSCSYAAALQRGVVTVAVAH